MQNQAKSETQSWTILKLLNWTTSYFKSHNIENPRASAEILLAHALKCKRIDLYAYHDKPLSQKELAIFRPLIKRRAKSEPVAYITGKKEFWSLDFIVTKDVLIPRPDTERLVETALKLLCEKKSGDPLKLKILELGTGSGAISLALASERKDCLFFASDISFPALCVAGENARNLGLAEHIGFFCGKWFEALNPGLCAFDMIVSNPPYVRRKDISGLQKEISGYEPQLALDGGEDGLDAIRKIVGHAFSYLKDDGKLLIEMGYDQKNEVENMVKACGKYNDISFVKDYGGHFRVAIIKR